MRLLKHIYYGILIGVSVITPGLSGGTTALILGVYKNIMESASAFNKRPIKSIFYLFPFMSGAIIGLVVCLKPIKYIINNYEIMLNYFVIGIIFGSVSSFIPKTKTPPFRVLLFVTLGAVPVVAQLYLSTNLNYSGIIYDAFVALLSSIALILPGISLTNILICFGKYKVIIDSLTNGCYNEIISFIVLLIIETVACVKIINYFYKKHTESINLVLLGMVLASSIPLFKIIPNGIEILYCGILLFVGFGICFSFGRVKV